MSRIVSGFIFLVFSPAAPARNLPSVAKDEKIKTDTQVTPTGYAVLPYIKGLTEPLTRVRRKHDIKFFNKPTGTLQQEFPSPKDRPETEKQTDTSSTKSPAKTALGVILAKREAVSKHERKNILGMSSKT